MKFLVFGLALLVAGASAFPDKVQVSELQERNFVDNLKRFIDAFRTLMIDNGFDPFIVNRHERDVAFLPYLNIQYLIKELEFTGASNIVIHTLEYSNIFNRFRYDLELPELALSVGLAKINGLVLSRNLNSQLSGALKVSGIRIAGESYVTIDLLGRITIDSLVARFTLGGVEADLEVTIQENDYSERINIFINDRIPAWLEDNESDINRALGTIIKYIAQRILSR